MVKVHHDSSGNILGFYPDGVGYASIPEPFIDIDDATHADCIANPGRRRVDVAAGQIVAYTPPGPTPEERAEGIKRSLINVVQANMDAAAQALGYDDIKSAVTYADEPAVPKFQAEGQAFRAWRSRAWQYCYDQLDAITTGARTNVPTAEELIDELQANVPLVLPE
ncbi:MAG: hypothetical protein RIN56_00070 [Sporomusaceae bacterium]|nr:hypothetical protein [Sporomusaceae bacterium]